VAMSFNLASVSRRCLGKFGRQGNGTFFGHRLVI
jgi:hypothetical protein